jgi:hypothetical protein
MTAILTAEAREIIRNDAMWAMGHWADSPIETIIFADEMKAALAVQAEFASHGIAPCAIVVRDNEVPPDRAVTIIHSAKDESDQIERVRCYLTQDHLQRLSATVEQAATLRAFERLALMLDRKHKAAPPDRRDRLDQLLHELAEYL